MDFGELINRHGWHVIAEVAVFSLVLLFSIVYLTALFRGRVKAVVCPSCGRVASRANALCPRCGEHLESRG